MLPVFRGASVTLRSECRAPKKNRVQAGKARLNSTRVVLSSAFKALLATILYGLITASLPTNIAPVPPEGRQRPCLQVSHFYVLLKVKVMFHISKFINQFPI